APGNHHLGRWGADNFRQEQPKHRAEKNSLRKIVAHPSEATPRSRQWWLKSLRRRQGPTKECASLSNPQKRTAAGRRRRTCRRLECHCRHIGGTSGADGWVVSDMLRRTQDYRSNV